MTLRKVQWPLHVGEVAGRPVRYFAPHSWLRAGIPDMPWHSTADLWAALGLGDAAAGLLRSLRADWPEPVTLATPDGLVTAAPHFMAEGLIEALGELPSSERPDGLLKARGAYRRNCTEAMKAMLPGTDAIGRLAFALEAMEAGPA